MTDTSHENSHQQQEGSSGLRQQLEKVQAETGLQMQELTVLAAKNDPFRVDTPARHRDGQWLADNATALGFNDRTIHLRGLHYSLIGRRKPDGESYTNTEEDWTWLSENAAKAARWLGYIPFDRIVDQRNAAPTVMPFSRPFTQAWIRAGIEVPEAAEFTAPYVAVHDFRGVQPHHLVFFGEKSSLEDVLRPLAMEYSVDLYLPTGEISDTQLHQMAQSGSKDGRRMIVFTFSDADPSGWQMPISISRKLQAFKVALYPDLDFEVRRVALTPGQVRLYGLPSTPLKASEMRADAWSAATKIAQTEIDSLASLRPDLLRELARAALTPFFDKRLPVRVAIAEMQWRREALEAISDAVDSDQVAQLAAEAEEAYSQFRAKLSEINSAVQFDINDFDLPDIEIPQAELEEPDELPLIDSRWSFLDQTTRLIDAKAYRELKPVPEDKETP